MNDSAERVKVRFASGDSDCAAWHYPGTNGGCVVMAAGLAVTKEPGTDPFAVPFNAAGFAVLAFDYRCFGDSGGTPRQVARIGDQLADWAAAIDFAATLTVVDPTRIAIWGFSSSGGHVVQVAARHRQVAAAIAQTPLVDGPAAGRHTMSSQTTLGLMRFVARASLDAVGGWFGRGPRLVPLAGEPGTVTSLTTPDALEGERALNPDGRYPQWQQAVAARSALRMGSYRPGRAAGDVQCPLLVVVGDDDGVTPPAASARVAERAPRGELAHLPGGHYAPFTHGHRHAVEIELSFLRRYLLDEPDNPNETATAAEPNPSTSRGATS